MGFQMNVKKKFKKNLGTRQMSLTQSSAGGGCCTWGRRCCSGKITAERQTLWEYYRNTMIQQVWIDTLLPANDPSVKCIAFHGCRDYSWWRIITVTDRCQQSLFTVYRQRWMCEELWTHYRTSHLVFNSCCFLDPHTWSQRWCHS